MRKPHALSELSDLAALAFVSALTGMTLLIACNRQVRPELASNDDGGQDQREAQQIGCTTPALPDEMLNTLVARPNAPTVFWHSDPSYPNETVLLAGSSLDNVTGVHLEGIAKSDVFRSGADIPILQQSPNSLKFVVPSHFVRGPYRYQLRQEHRVIADGILNLPEIWWIQSPHTIFPGSTLRVFGRSLASSRAMNTCSSYIALRGARTVILTSFANDEYSLIAKLPTNVIPGKYRLYVYNGLPGSNLWSQPIEIDVVHVTQPPASEVNVKACGAKADGFQDDTEAFNCALQKASQVHANVYVPRGRYLISGPLTVPQNVTLKGERTDFVSLMWPDTPSPPSSLISGAGQFSIQSLTIYASNYENVISNTDPKLGHVSIVGVRVRANKYVGHLEVFEPSRDNQARLHERSRRDYPALAKWGSRQSAISLAGPDIEVTDSDVYSSNTSLWVSNSTDAVIRRNILYSGMFGGYYLVSTRRTIFEDNTIAGADPEATGGGISNWGDAPSEHIYFARNTITHAYGNDREGMTTDASGNGYLGNVRVTSPTSLELLQNQHKSANLTKLWIGQGAFILAGKGLGQFRRVQSFEGRVLTIDRPWQIEPDQKSLVSVTQLVHQLMFVDNSFTDCGQAIQLHGSSVDIIMTRNTATRTGGFRTYSLDYYGLQPNWFIEFLDNVIAEGNAYRAGHDKQITASDTHLGVYAFGAEVPLTRNIVLRGNELRSNATLQVGGADTGRDAPSAPNLVTDVVVEFNRISNTTTGISIRKPELGFVIRRNIFENVTNEVVVQGVHAQSAD